MQAAMYGAAYSAMALVVAFTWIISLAVAAAERGSVENFQEGR